LLYFNDQEGELGKKKKKNTRDREHTKSNSTTVEAVDPHGFTKVLINKEALLHTRSAPLQQLWRLSFPRPADRAGTSFATP
jgi:hypothetical protein